MTTPAKIQFAPVDIEIIASFEGRVALCLGSEGKMDRAARRVNRLTRGAVERFAGSKAFAALKEGEAAEIPVPQGMAAQVLQIVKIERRADVEVTRKAGAAIGKAFKGGDILVLAGGLKYAGELALGAALRAYAYSDQKSKKPDALGAITVAVNAPESFDASAVTALAEGVFFTRDLVSMPANVLTTQHFADELVALKSLGLEVEVLEEKDLEKLGMGALLCVGQGSDSPSKVVVMQWKGGKKGAAPFALVGKGVVFDTGGISIKPAAGMEDMTMDMGGAGTVSGVMKALAMRGAKANVVGLVGIVENMPSGNAVRPGDVVKSMKGDTIEVINTDAEGRLVLCDVMWYAQERFKPTGMIDLATLTGAIIIGLGHDNAGVFSNDNPLCNAFLKAAGQEAEGAWRMPLGQSYDDQLKSAIADMKNVGGRPAGSITAAQFLKRFVRDETPWIHLDIAGVASVKSDTALAPKGATGWGVLALNRLIANMFEAEAKE
ncbi:MAG: leucyl aminopeptidase [Halocynthiibacter sp.]|jgi:leucyl aminopeptidase